VGGVLSARATAIKLVTGVSGTNQYLFWEVTAQQPRWCFSFDPRCQGAMRVAEEDASGPVWMAELSVLCHSQVLGPR